MQWKSNHSAAIGRSHLLRGLPCQDQCASLSRNGISSIALADGAGSASLSQEGARIAVQTACALLCDCFDEFFQAPKPHMVRTRLLNAVVAAIKQRAKSLNALVEDLACTLLAVAVKGDRYLLFHVGDGVIVCQVNGRLKVASAPTNGEFANTTVFVTSPYAIRTGRVLRGTQPALEGFFLMSDGCETALYQSSTGKPAPLIRKTLLWNQLMPSDRASFLLSQILKDVIVPLCRDDCSLAVLTRPVERFGNWNRMTMREKADTLGVSTENANRRRRAVRKRAKRWGIVMTQNAS